MNFKLTFRKVFLIPFIIIFFASCLYNVAEEVPEPDQKVSFKDAVKPIIDARCVSCHTTGGTSPDLSSFTKIKANANAVKIEVDSRRMPQGSTLTSAQIATIVNWVDEGALDN